MVTNRTALCAISGILFVSLLFVFGPQDRKSLQAALVQVGTSRTVQVGRSSPSETTTSNRLEATRVTAKPQLDQVHQKSASLDTSPPPRSSDAEAENENKNVTSSPAPTVNGGAGGGGSTTNVTEDGGKTKKNEEKEATEKEPAAEVDEKKKEKIEEEEVRSSPSPPTEASSSKSQSVSVSKEKKNPFIPEGDITLMNAPLTENGTCGKKPRQVSLPAGIGDPMRVPKNFPRHPAAPACLLGTGRGEDGSKVTADWKIEKRKKCVSELERLTTHMDRWRRYGKWSRAMTKSIRVGAVHCPDIVPPPSETRHPSGKGGRRIYIDLGASGFTTSVASMLMWYSGGVTFDIHAFEANPAHATSYQFSNRPKELAWTENVSVAFHNRALSGSDGFFSYVSRDPKHRENFKRDGQLTSTGSSMVFHQDKNDVPKDTYLTIPCRNICNYFLEDLKVTPRDYVIFKVDIEGGEWPVLEALETQCKDTVLKAGLIDEFFFECHYDKMGGAFQGIPFKQCADVYTRWRSEYHILAHEWV